MMIDSNSSLKCDSEIKRWEKEQKWFKAQIQNLILKLSNELRNLVMRNNSLKQTF